MEVTGKVFIVTGASSRIGLATAVALTERGAKVAHVARSTDALQTLAGTLRGSLAVTADMTNFVSVRSAIQRIHKHYDRIDGLINNAGRSYAASIEKIEPELFDEFSSERPWSDCGYAVSYSYYANTRSGSHCQRKFRYCLHDDTWLQRVLLIEARFAGI